MKACIAPLVRLPSHKDLFDYQIPDSLSGMLSVGDLVEIPWRSKKAYGVITGIGAEEKHVPYQLKQVFSLVEKQMLTHEQFLLGKRFCAFYGATFSRFLRMVIPEKPKRKSAAKTPVHALASLFTPSPSISAFCISKTDTPQYALMHDIESFLSALCAVIGSQKYAYTMIFVPTIELANLFASILRNAGIQQVVSVHSGLNKNQYWNAYTGIRDGAHRVIITTRQGVFLPIQKNSCIIFYDASNEDFKQSEQHPRYDARRVAQWVARQSECVLLFATHTPPLGVKKQALIPIPHTLQTQTRIRLVDMQQTLSQRAYAHLSFQTCSIIQDTVEKGKKVIALALRKQHATGVSVETLYSVLTKNKKNGKIVVDSAESDIPSDYDVLVGTPSLLEGLKLAQDRHKIGLLVISSIEPLLALPDYRSAERAYARLSHWKMIAQELGIPEIVLQSYTPEAPVMRAFAYGEYTAFKNNELLMRKKLLYPPYAQLIKLSYNGLAESEIALVRKKLEHYHTDGIRVSGPFTDQKSKQCLLIRLLKNTQLPILSTLSPFWSIDREPENIL